MSVAETLHALIGEKLDKTLLITMGNSLRSDDGVGPYIAERLEGLSGIQIEDAGNRPERSIDWVEEYQPELVVFLDAADFGGIPGELRRIDARALAKRSLSSHRLPMEPLIAWIEQESGAKCNCLGIQASSLDLGEQIAQPVIDTAEQIIDWLNQQAKAQ